MALVRAWIHWALNWALVALPHLVSRCPARSDRSAAMRFVWPSIAAPRTVSCRLVALPHSVSTCPARRVRLPFPRFVRLSNEARRAREMQVPGAWPSVFAPRRLPGSARRWTAPLVVAGKRRALNRPWFTAPQGVSAPGVSSSKRMPKLARSRASPRTSSRSAGGAEKWMRSSVSANSRSRSRQALTGAACSAFSNFHSRTAEAWATVPDNWILAPAKPAVN